MLKTVALPNCKSLLIRRMVLRYVYDGEVADVPSDECSDVQVTRRALLTLRADAGSSSPVEVDVADCGAAYRFLMALLAVTPGRWLLTGTPRLLERPVGELVEALSNIGADIRRVSGGWLIAGRALRADTLTVSCARSSQFASALLLISPIIGLETLHIVPADAVSLPYVRMTLACMRNRVSVPAVPAVPDDLGKIGDWSAAVFWYAQAMLHPGDEYELTGLSLSSVQGDSVVADWFASMGVSSVPTPDGLIVRAERPSALIPMTFDVAGHPDLVPVMAALACLLPADFTFRRTRNLQFKESRRTEVLRDQLLPYSDIAVLDDDSFRVKGKSRGLWGNPPYTFRTCADHRLAMAFLLFGKDAVLDDTRCLRKSYPNLLEQLRNP